MTTTLPGNQSQTSTVGDVIDVWDCSDTTPSAYVLLFKLRDANLTTPLVIVSVLVLLSWLIFFDQIAFSLRNGNSIKRNILTIWVTGAFPIISLLSLIGLFVPRSYNVVDYGLSFYFVYSLKQFYCLLVDYYGGRKTMLAVMQQSPYISANPFPWCCIFCCCHRQPMTMHRLKVTEGLINQIVFTFPVLFFIITLCESDGVQDTIIGGVLLSLLRALSIVSSFICLYGFTIIHKSSREALAEFRMRGKVLTIQGIIVFNTVQGFTINTIDRWNKIPCGFPYPTKEKAFAFQSYILICELFVLSVASIVFFRRSDNDCKVVRKNDANFTAINSATSTTEIIPSNGNDIPVTSKTNLEDSVFEDSTKVV